MGKVSRLILVICLFLFLVIIRGYIAPYFYDPLDDYFKGDHLLNKVPEIDYVFYFFNLFLRYSLNSIVSLCIIYLIFKNRGVLEFSMKFYLIAFFVLSLFLFLILKYFNDDGYILLFYIRRFLIHPLFVVVLIPAFYYQKLQSKN